MEFKRPTTTVELVVIRLTGVFPHTRSADVLARESIRGAISIGPHYRAACRGKSAADVMVKLSIVEEEARETIYWPEILGQRFDSAKGMHAVVQEIDEIPAMTGASIKTLRARFSSIQKRKSKF